MELISKRISEIKNKCRWCIVVSHGGEEFSPMPLPYTRDRYIRFLQMGADVVVGHHPHVVENYELFEDGKMIFYSLGNFIFDTDYQRAHLYTDIGVLLKLNFSYERIEFETIGIKINRKESKIIKCGLPDIFANISSKEYDLLAPLAAKAFVAEDMRKMIYLQPSIYSNNSEALESYFSGCTHEDYVKGSHMDFDIIIPLAEKYKKMQWRNSELEKVKNYILTLL
jgi:poly-gamma-glutamate synthesis protein (capsule biosynthesis protein)